MIREGRVRGHARLGKARRVGNWEFDRPPSRGQQSPEHPPPLKLSAQLTHRPATSCEFLPGGVGDDTDPRGCEGPAAMLRHHDASLNNRRKTKKQVARSPLPPRAAERAPGRTENEKCGSQWAGRMLHKLHERMVLVGREVAQGCGGRGRHPLRLSVAQKCSTSHSRRNSGTSPTLPHVSMCIFLGAGRSGPAACPGWQPVAVLGGKWVRVDLRL
jgi:hypothetical protein